MSKYNEQQDIHFMKIALNEARKNLGYTAPNPSVGCVIVKDHNVISVGVTGKGGSPHGEVDAISKCSKDQLNGATAYVTLEPCCFYGKNPPCTEALINSKIARVVIANTDPFSKVAGKGIKDLEKANIKVTLNVCRQEAEEINIGFFKVCKEQKPFVTLKLAVSLDSKIATKSFHSKWITNEKSRQYSHKLRENHDAIMVGSGTVKKDNPSLTCRLKSHEDIPLVRIVISSQGMIDENSNLINTANENNKLWIINTSNRKNTNYNPYIEFIDCTYDNSNKVDLEEALKILAKKGITRLLVEGGGAIAASMIKNKLVDQLQIIKAPILIGGDGIDAIASIGVNKIDECPILKFKESFSTDNNIVQIFDF